MKYDVIVIGAGPGGSACAALLSSRGYKTLLIEKNNWVGGKAATLERFGHRVDLFAHLLADGGEIRKALEEMGKTGAVEITAKDPTLYFVTEDGTRLRFGFEDMKEILRGYPSRDR